MAKLTQFLMDQSNTNKKNITWILQKILFIQNLSSTKTK